MSVIRSSYYHNQTPYRSIDQQRNSNYNSIDKKHITEIIRSQNIDLPQNFFTEPTKRDAICVLKDFIRVVLGYSINISSLEQLKGFVVERLLNRRPGSVPFDYLIAYDVNINLFLPDQGKRHITAVEIMALYRCLKQFGIICGVENVTLEDVLQPTGERMLLYGACLVDFISFQENYMLDMYVKWSKIREDRHIISETKKKTQLIRDELEALAPQTEKQRKQLQELVEQEQEASQKLKQLAYSVHTSRDNVSQAEDESRKAENQLKLAENKISALQTEIAQLTSQIVDSPKRVTQTLKDTDDLIIVLDQGLEEASIKLPAMQLQCDRLEHLLQEFEKCGAYLKDYEKNTQDLYKVSETVLTLKKKAENAKSELDNLTEEVDQLRETLSVLSDTLNTARAETNETEKQYESTVKKHALEQENHNEKQRARKNDIEDMKRELMELLHINEEISNKEAQLREADQSNENYFVSTIEKINENISNQFVERIKSMQQSIAPVQCKFMNALKYINEDTGYLDTIIETLEQTACKTTTPTRLNVESS